MECFWDMRIKGARWDKGRGVFKEKTKRERVQVLSKTTMSYRILPERLGSFYLVTCKEWRKGTLNENLLVLPRLLLNGCLPLITSCFNFSVELISEQSCLVLMGKWS